MYTLDSHKTLKHSLVLMNDSTCLYMRKITTRQAAGKSALFQDGEDVNFLSLSVKGRVCGFVALCNLGPLLWGPAAHNPFPWQLSRFTCYLHGTFSTLASSPVNIQYYHQDNVCALPSRNGGYTLTVKKRKYNEALEHQVHIPLATGASRAVPQQVGGASHRLAHTLSFHAHHSDSTTHCDIVLEAPVGCGRYESNTPAPHPDTVTTTHESKPIGDD